MKKWIKKIFLKFPKIKLNFANFWIILLIGLGVVILVVPSPVFSIQTIIGNVENLSELICALIDFSIIIIGPLAALMLMIGGILYATAGGNPQKAELAKDIIGTTIICVIAFLLIWVVFKTVIGKKFC